MLRIIPTKNESHNPVLELFQILDVSFGMRWSYHAMHIQGMTEPKQYKVIVFIQYKPAKVFLKI